MQEVEARGNNRSFDIFILTRHGGAIALSQRRVVRVLAYHQDSSVTVIRRCKFHMVHDRSLLNRHTGTQVARMKVKLIISVLGRVGLIAHLIALPRSPVSLGGRLCER